MRQPDITQRQLTRVPGRTRMRMTTYAPVSTDELDNWKVYKLIKANVQ